jgi:hypothetical protein
MRTLTERFQSLNGMYQEHAAGILRRKCEFNPMDNDRIPSLTEIPRRREIDKKPDSLVRQRGSLRAQIARRQRNGSPDVAKIAAYEDPDHWRGCCRTRRAAEMDAPPDENGTTYPSASGGTCGNACQAPISGRRAGMKVKRRWTSSRRTTAGFLRASRRQTSCRRRCCFASCDDA